VSEEDEPHLYTDILGVQNLLISPTSMDFWSLTKTGDSHNVSDLTNTRNESQIDANVGYWQVIIQCKGVRR